MKGLDMMLCISAYGLVPKHWWALMEVGYVELSVAVVTGVWFVVSLSTGRRTNSVYGSTNTWALWTCSIQRGGQRCRTRACSAPFNGGGNCSQTAGNKWRCRCDIAVPTAEQIADIRGSWGGEVGHVVYLLKCLWLYCSHVVQRLFPGGNPVWDNPVPVCSVPMEGLDGQREKN